MQKPLSPNVIPATAASGTIAERSVHRIAVIASVIAILLGIVVALGWIFDIAFLKNVLPDLATMKMNTAVAFVLAGISLKLQLAQPATVSGQQIARACALLLAALGMLTLSEYALGVELGIDHVLFHVSTGEADAAFPGRMAPNTALNCMLVGMALLWLSSVNRALQAASQTLTIAVLFLSFVAAIGYLLDVRALYGVPGYASMALHTCIGFAVLAIGVIAARPQRGVIAILLQDNPAGVMARRILPLIVGTLLAIGWLRLKGQQAGFYGTEFGLALMIAACTSVLALIVLWNASVQGRAEKSRQEAVRLIDAVKDYAIFMLDPHGTVITWNAGAERLQGYQAEEIVGKSFACFYTADDVMSGKPAAALSTAARDERYEDEEWRVRKDGSKFLANVLITALRNDRRQLIGFAKVTRDITERTRADEARQQMTALVESAEDAILTKSLDGIVRSWNPAAERLLGYRAEEMIGQSVMRLLPDDRQSEEVMILEQIKHGQPVAHFETVRRCKDGSLLDVSLTISPIRDRAGVIIGASKIMRDITERKRAAEQLRTLNMKLEEQIKLRSGELRSVTRDLTTILDALPSMVGYWDKDLRNRFANHAYQSWFGVDPKTLTGTHIRDVLGEDLYARNRPYREAVLRGESVTFEQQLPRVGAAGVRHSIVHYVPDIVDSTVQGFYVLVHDISELTESNLKMETLLYENAGLLNTLDYHSLVLMTDVERKIIYANDAFCLVSGYNRAELLGQDQDLISSSTDDPEFWSGVWRVVSSDLPWHGEICSRTKYGSLYWVNAIIAPIHGADGKIAKYVSIRTDITATKRVAMQLQEVIDRFAIAADAAHLGVWQFDVVRNTVTWDEGMHRIYGCEPGTHADLYELWTRSLHPDDRERCAAEVAAVLHGAAEFNTEFRIIRPDGSIRYVTAASHTVRGADGAAIRMTGVNIDVTERRRAELELLETSSLLQTVLDSVSDVAIIACDPNVNITIFNTGAERLLGYSSDEVLGRAPALFHDADEIRMRGAELTTQLGREIEGVAIATESETLRMPHEWTYVRKDGQRITVSLIITPMYGHGGELLGYVGVAYDVTQQKQYQESLRRAVINADQANRAKSEFLANMSHEIRTPLNAVIGIGYLLEQTALNADQRALLSKIQFAGRALLGVVNNVLDLSKIEAGEMTLEETPFDLLQLVRELGQMLASQAQSKGIELIVSPSADVPRWLVSDVTRLRQILINLLNNSIKFTEAGSVELQVSSVGHSRERARLRFVVRDTGIGMTPETIKRLFTPFAQADASVTRRFGGTGLGLSIARRFVELMDGEIGVTSTVGVGSEFWFEIPMRIAQEAERAADGAATRALQILIAESHDNLPDALAGVVRALGWRPQTVTMGEEILKRLLTAQPTAWPDVVLLDAHLHDIDALQLIARLKQQFAHIELPPIIVVVDQAYSDLKLEELKLAASAVIARPMTSSVLFNAVNVVVSERNAGHERLLQSTHFDEVRAQWLPGVQVLVADDSDINLEVARRILERQGAVVVTCMDGSEAVECVRQQPDKFDVVLMDVQMPTLDGNEATRRIRTELQLQKLPIIALTAGALVAERQRSLEAGMNDVLTKPFDPQTLVRVVRRLVETARGAQVPVAILDQTSNHAGVEPSLSCIDPKVVQQMFGEDVTLFKSLLARVLRDYAEFALPIAVDLDEAAVRKQLTSRIHKLRGSAGAIGAVHVQRFAAAAERALGSDQPPDFVTAILQQLTAAFSALNDEAQPLLSAHDKQTDSTDQLTIQAATQTAVSTATIKELCELLESQNLDALDRFASLSQPLSAMLGAARFSPIRDAIESLDFRRGAELLRSVAAPSDTQATGT